MRFTNTDPAKACVKKGGQMHPPPYDSEILATLDHSPSNQYNVDMVKRRSKKLTDQVRQAIDDSGLTRYRISQDTGIDESSLAKFYNGKRGLSLDNLDLLCEYIGLRIVIDRRPKA
jgi:hypothetical protein